MRYFPQNKGHHAHHNQYHRHVALIIETSNEYARGLLRGIRKYIDEHQRWSVYLWEHDRGSKDLSWLNNWHGDGILARIENESIAQFVREKQLPAVDLSAFRYIPDIPCVETNDQEIAQLAFEHLIDRGYRSFAYCGNRQFYWSRHRMHHFCAHARQSGHEVTTFNSSAIAAKEISEEQNDMIEWLLRLDKPCGVMACYDIQGQRLLEACTLAGMKVPEEVGVIGVDNDPLLCDLTSPSLSSVRPNPEKTGFEASALLDKIICGDDVPSQLCLINPVGVVPRQSTDVLYMDDELLSSAVRFIRSNAHLNINVKDVLDVVPMSRAVLEGLFRKKLGRTPHQEIMRSKLVRAKTLLIETDLPVAIVCERSGFSNPDYFSVVFKKHLGQSPTAFREQSSG